jgi:L-rhamnonate dehydratase
MRITDVKTIALKSFGIPPPKGLGNPTVNPLSIFPPDDKVHRMRQPSLGALLVQVTTDEDITGIASVGLGHEPQREVVERRLKPIVVGEDPFQVELLWAKMFRATVNIGRKGAVLEAISGVDIALWDIMGKATGQPVYNLLGGKTHDRIQVYASRLYARTDLDGLAAEARSYLDQGFTFMKLRFGYGPRDGLVGMKKNVELVRTVREVIGDEVQLAGDAYMGWDVPYAIAMIRRLEAEDVNLAWVEEPVMPDDVDGYARVRAAVRTPISGGEHEFTRYGFRELIAKQAVDILQPDVNRVGGITEARKIWAMAAAYDLQVTPHAGQSHNYHLVISHLNSPISEYFPKPAPGVIPDGNEAFWWIFKGEPEVVDGHVSLNGKPGLGLELDEEIIEKYRLE